MTRKRFSIVGILAALLALVFASTGILSASPDLGPAQEAPKDGIKLKCKKGDATFNHSTHQSVSCDKCHHKAQDGKTHVGCKGCHNAKSKVKSKKAFHGQCVSCHKKTVKKDASKKGKIPVKCKECHIK